MPGTRIFVRCRTILVRYYAHLGNWRKATEVVRAWYSSYPKDDEFRFDHILVNILAAEGEFDEARKMLYRRSEYGRAFGATYNGLAWFGLFTKQPNTGRLLNQALHAYIQSQGKNEAIIHTLATVYAEIGHLRACMTLLRLRSVLAGTDKMQRDDVYPVARLLEHIGLHKYAIEAYKQIRKPSLKDASDTYTLAKRRLLQLETSP